MSEVIRGAVVEVNIASKFGPERRIKLNNEKWYSAAADLTDLSALESTNTVDVKIEGSGNQIAITKVKLVTKGAGRPAGGGGFGGGKRFGGGGGGGGGAKSNLSKEEWAEKDRSIQYQSARKDAIVVLHQKIELGLVSLGSKTAKPAVREAVYNDLLDRETKRLFEDIEKRGAVVRTDAQLDESDELEPDSFDSDDLDTTPDASDDGFDDEEIPF